MSPNDAPPALAPPGGSRHIAGRLPRGPEGTLRSPGRVPAQEALARRQEYGRRGTKSRKQGVRKMEDFCKILEAPRRGGPTAGGALPPTLLHRGQSAPWHALLLSRGVTAGSVGPVLGGSGEDAGGIERPGGSQLYSVVCTNWNQNA